MIVPWSGLSFGLYVISAVIVLALTVSCWRRFPAAPLALRYSALLLATVLVAPHLTVYDLVILAPALLLMADWLISQMPSKLTQRLGTLLYLVYMLPLLGPLSRWTHVQLSVVAMAAVIYLIWSIVRQAGGRSTEIDTNKAKIASA